MRWPFALALWLLALAAQAQAGADAGTGQSKPAAKTTTKAATPAAKATTKATAPKTSKAAKPAAKKSAASKPPVVAAPPPPAAVAPAPPVQPVQVAEAQAKVAVPSTPHVHVEVPSGLQHWLDEDDRMRPWLAKAVNATDGCYAELRAKNPQAAGVVEFAVTMHKDARPTASVTSMPSPLKSLVLCVTSQLWSIKMPLFTGNEGARYAVRARFEP